MVNSVMRGAFLKDPTCAANSSRCCSEESARLTLTAAATRDRTAESHHARPPAVRQPRRRPRSTDELNRSCAVASQQPGLGITGVLCFSAGIFLQVLEGGRSAVNELYNHIVRRPAPHPGRTAAQLRGDRRAPLCRLVDGPGEPPRA
jgi:hypothetical protein